MVLPTPTPTPTPSAADSTATPTTVAGEGTPTPTTVAGEGTPTPTSVAGEGTPTPTTVAGEGTPTPTTVAGEGTPTPTSEAGADMPTPTNTPVPQTIQAEVNVEQGGSMNVTNNRGLTCNVQVPPNGVAEAITLHYQEASTPSTKPGTRFAHGGHAFTLTAHRNGEELADYTFAQPATMRFNYDDSGMSLEEEQRLLLYSRSTSSDPWELAATATHHAYDTDNNQVTVLVDHLSEFALFYEQDATQIQTVYLPLITRNSTTANTQLSSTTLSNTQLSSTTLVSTVVCLNPPPVPMPDGFTPDADAQAALDHVNEYRDLVGLPPMRLHPNIILAAQNHATYLITNDGNSAAFPDLGRTPSSHGEVEGFPGFTGASVNDRLYHTGYLIEDNYDRVGMGEVISYRGDPEAAVDGWIETVYHRFPFMDATIDEMGYAKDDDNNPDTWNKADVMNFGRSKWRPIVDTSKVIVYPADGQTGLNPGWNSNSESPDPYPDDDMVGTVITLSPVGIQTFDSLELRPDGGNAVAMHPLEQDSSDYYTAAQDPLEANTTYNVKATGTDNAGNPLTLEWSFTTGE